MRKFLSVLPRHGAIISILCMVQKIDTLKKSPGIVGLVIVLGVGFVALIGGITAARGTLGQFVQQRNIVSGDQAFYTAESNATEGLFQLLHSSQSTYSGGDGILLNDVSTARIETESVTCADTRVRGIADKRKNHREVVAVVRMFPECLPFQYAVFTPNELDLNGNATVNGSAFATNGIDLSGSAEINGDTIEGTTSPVPQFDGDPYRDAATVGGTLFTNPADAESYLSNQTRNAVVFVDSPGTVHITGNNTDLTGSLWVEGDLELNGGHFVGDGSYAALVVRGDLTLTGNSHIEGIVYVIGSTTVGAGTIIIDGSLISIGETNVTNILGNVTVNYDPSLLDIWEDTIGLEPSDFPPEILSWGEE